jgi:predicted nucleotidyltransferase
MAEMEETKKAKTLLYAYRVLLTGIHVLRTGEIEANLPNLLEVYPLSGVRELMAAKVKEKAGIPAADLVAHRRALEELETRLEQCFLESRLPEAPREAAALDRFLVRLRLRKT